MDCFPQAHMCPMFPMSLTELFQVLRPDTHKAFPLLPLICFLMLSNTLQVLTLPGDES